MALIRNSKAAGMVREAVVLDFADLEGQAKRLLERARGEADRILAQAREDAERLAAQTVESIQREAEAQARERGFEQGLAEGRAQALDEARPELTAATAAFERALSELEARRDEIYIEARADVLRFALALARRVVHRIVEADPEVVREQLAAALSRLSARTPVVVAVHPRDHALATAVLPALLERFGQGKDASLVADENVGPGGCVIRTAWGEVDATIATQLNRIAEALAPHDATSHAGDAPASILEGRTDPEAAA